MKSFVLMVLMAISNESLQQASDDRIEINHKYTYKLFIKDCLSVSSYKHGDCEKLFKISQWITGCFDFIHCPVLKRKDPQMRGERHLLSWVPLERVNLNHWTISSF
jgi:hypothetical protein